VNISSVQFTHMNLASTVAAALRESGLGPRYWLQLEITEAILMQAPKLAGQELAVLRELGLTVATGDVGTGYANLLTSCGSLLII